jgi:hypothetical protein
MRAMAQEAGKLDPNACKFIRLGRLLHFDRYIQLELPRLVWKHNGAHVLFDVRSLGRWKVPEIRGRSNQSRNRIVYDSC